MLDKNKPIPEIINMGQYPITKAEYLQMVANGEDVSMASDMIDPKPSATKFQNDVVVSSVIDDLRERLLKLSNLNTRYLYNSGKDEQVSPYTQIPAFLDEASFLGWTLYELGAIGSSKAILDFDEILKLKELTNVTPVEISTSSDSSTFKMEIVNKAHIGDIMMFDKNSPNDSVGFYMGAGQIFIQRTNITPTSDTGMAMLYMLDDDGYNYDPTSVLDDFNGTIYRISEYNGEGFNYYSEGIDM
jgi:hypothetical protein